MAKSLESTHHNKRAVGSFGPKRATNAQYTSLVRGLLEEGQKTNMNWTLRKQGESNQVVSPLRGEPGDNLTKKGRS